MGEEKTPVVWGHGKGAMRRLVDPTSNQNTTSRSLPISQNLRVGLKTARQLNNAQNVHKRRTKRGGEEGGTEEGIVGYGVYSSRGGPGLRLGVKNERKRTNV